MVVGQNGAGKSTLAKVCAGLVTPTAGSVRIMGSVLGDGQRDAGALGLAMVHQHFSLPPSFTVAEALEATTSGSPIGFFRRQRVERRWADHLRSNRHRSSARVRDLPIETRQQLEIARALTGNARVLVLDEPTAVLAPAAIERLFARLRALNESGVTLMLILHKLSEVFEIADTVSVLRDGALMLSPTSVSQLSERQLSDEMIGPRRGPDRPAVVERLAATAASHRPKIELCSVTSTDNGTEPPLQDVSLVVGEGGIVGVAGVEGNGQRSLVESWSGSCPAASGRADGRRRRHPAPPCGPGAPPALRTMPFDRNTEGTSQTSNACGRTLRRCRPRRARARGSRRPGCDAAAGRRSTLERELPREPTVHRDLSGGNVQKTILARELSERGHGVRHRRPPDARARPLAHRLRPRRPDRGRGRTVPACCWSRRTSTSCSRWPTSWWSSAAGGSSPRSCDRTTARRSATPCWGSDRDDRVDPFRDVDRVLARGLVRPRRADVLGERCQPDRSGQRLDRGRGDGAGRDDVERALGRASRPDRAGGAGVVPGRLLQHRRARPDVRRRNRGNRLGARAGGGAGVPGRAARARRVGRRRCAVVRHHRTSPAPLRRQRDPDDADDELPRDAVVAVPHSRTDAERGRRRRRCVDGTAPGGVPHLRRLRRVVHDPDHRRGRGRNDGGPAGGCDSASRSGFSGGTPR